MLFVRAKRKSPPELNVARQRGQAALIAVLLLIGLGAAAFVYALATPAKITIENDKKTAAALAQAKDALIGYATRVGEPGSTKPGPGYLPCPDTTNDGIANSPCGAKGATAIGRLPWKTLGLPDLRDGSGQCLWYAVSGNFKNSGTAAPDWVNSESEGTLVVNSTSGTSIYSGTNAVLAIVFAPGSPLAGQDHSSSSITACGGNTTVSNYLEGGNQLGATTNIFVTGPKTDTFNDKSLVVTSNALFSVVTTRVAKEIRTALNAYRTVNGYYPPANPYSDNTYSCAIGAYAGRVPLDMLLCASPPWDAELPLWYGANKWNEVTYYAVSQYCTTTTLIDLLLCNTLPGLTVSGINTSVRAVVFVTGRAMGTQLRPCTSVNQCLEDSENTDGNTTYTKPSRFPASNDRLSVVSCVFGPCPSLP
jgi:type II secretory pathway pseudopilin PulG